MSTNLLGKSVVFTGVTDFSNARTKVILESAGAVVRNGLSSVTDYLIVGGRPGFPTRDKAGEMGIPVISWKDLDLDDRSGSLEAFIVNSVVG